MLFAAQIVSFAFNIRIYIFLLFLVEFFMLYVYCITCQNLPVLLLSHIRTPKSLLTFCMENVVTSSFNPVWHFMSKFVVYECRVKAKNVLWCHSNIWHLSFDHLNIISPFFLCQYEQIDFKYIKKCGMDWGQSPKYNVSCMYHVYLLQCIHMQLDQWMRG